MNHPTSLPESSNTTPASSSLPSHRSPRKRSRRTDGGAHTDPLLQEPHNPVRREQALWRAVIMQMFTDALSNSRKYEALQHKREAEIWLRGTSRDFRTVCDYAGYDPDYVRQIARRLLTQHTGARSHTLDA